MATHRSASAALLLAALGCAGCMFGNSSQAASSHFVYPNSNVIPLQHAEGSHSKLCGLLVLTWGSPDGADQETATKEALAAARADVLINLRNDSRIFTIPGLFTICTTNVSGTAARMEVGRQQLGALNTAAMPSTTARPAGGCTSSNDCKGGRVCNDGACVEP